MADETPINYRTEGPEKITRIPDVPLDDPDDPDAIAPASDSDYDSILSTPSPKRYTRKVVSILFVDNAQDPNRPVKAILRHQKTDQRNIVWDRYFRLKDLDEGQELRLQLTSNETWRLYKELERAYALCAVDGRPRGERSYTFTGDTPRDDDVEDAPGAGSLPVARFQTLLELEGANPEAFWEMVGLMGVERLPEQVAQQRLIRARKAALAEFKQHLDAHDWSELDWQPFFGKNTWIFGYGLRFQFVDTLGTQAQADFPSHLGKDAQKADYLLALGAEVRFTVLLDIKHPQWDLLDHDPYRNDIYRVTQEVAGGVAQVQSYCRNFATVVAQNLDVGLKLVPQEIHTCEPKGFLVIGHGAELKGDHKKAVAFESFRRNLTNPEIITFDELYARACFIIDGAPREQTAT